MFELDHFGIDLRLRREYQSEAHYFLDYGTRLRHGSLSKTLGFGAGGPFGTFDGCLVTEMWPAPGHPAVEWLRAARTGPYKLLDMLDDLDDVQDVSTNAVFPEGFGDS